MSDEMRIFVFLHVLTMFGAVALSGGVDLLVLRVVATRDVRAIHTMLEARERLGRLIPVLFGIGLVFGLTAMVVEGFNPFAGWLLLAYPLFVAGILVGALGIARGHARVLAATASAPDSGTPELAELLASPAPRYATVIFWLIIATLIFVMIMKPLS